MSIISTYSSILEKLITPDLTDQSRSSKSSNQEYAYIGLPNEQFIKQLDTVASLRKCRDESNGHWIAPNSSWRPNFVEVGCGAGFKLILADGTWARGNGDYHIHLTGIENTPEYACAAKELLAKYANNLSIFEHKHCQGGNGKCVPTIIEANATDCDYSAYDIIYFYRPIIDKDKELVLEQRIIDTAKPGAYIIASYSVINKKELPDSIECLWDEPSRDHSYHHLGWMIWRKRNNLNGDGNE